MIDLLVLHLLHSVGLQLWTFGGTDLYSLLHANYWQLAIVVRLFTGVKSPDSQSHRLLTQGTRLGQ